MFWRVGLLFLMCVAPSLKAAPQYQQNRNANAMAVFRNAVDDLQHEVGNHDEELRLLEERVNTQETIVDSLRQQHQEDQENHRDTVAGTAAEVEKQASRVESSLSGVMTDIRRLQGHANDSAATLRTYKTKIDIQEKQLEELRVAVDSLLDALQLTTAHQVYEVRSGDSLEKIARRNNTSITKLKELNGLKSDRIYTGQKLKLP